ncbi:MAG: homoserine kinase, partial [Acidobacteriota bacterium]
MDEVTVLAPASVSNVVCGFDCLGFALAEPFDKLTVRRIAERTVRIRHLDDFGLPTEPEANVAGVALLALMQNSELDFGFEVDIEKGLMPGSGIGSSAASSCGAVVAANHLLDERFSKKELAEFAMAGERLASGARHADNVAPCIFGGFTLVRSIEPLDIVPLEFTTLYATVIHPQIQIVTADARAILPERVPLRDAVRQWANLGAFVAA